jgi:hypothetical protein
MMELQQYWPYIAAATGGIVWLIRLEGKVKQVERTQNTEGTRLVASMDKMSAAQDKMADTINEMRTTLAGVVGYEKGASEARKVGKR